MIQIRKENFILLLSLIIFGYVAFTLAFYAIFSFFIEWFFVVTSGFNFSYDSIIITSTIMASTIYLISLIGTYLFLKQK